MIASLEVLNYFSGRNFGIVTADSSLHYLWTYGPTLGMSPQLHDVPMPN
jgi:hypothetical protein